MLHYKLQKTHLCSGSELAYLNSGGYEALASCARILGVPTWLLDRLKYSQCHQNKDFSPQGCLMATNK